jgi:uncharacterized lipoprotein YajG
MSLFTYRGKGQRLSGMRPLVLLVGVFALAICCACPPGALAATPTQTSSANSGVTTGTELAHAVSD